MSALKPLTQYATKGANTLLIGVILPDTTSSVRWVDFDQPYLTAALADAGFNQNQFRIDNAQGSDATELDDANADINLGAGEDGTPGEKIVGQHFTPGVFEALGVRPKMGRTFAPDEDRVDDAARVVVISHDFWQRRFHGASDVVGKILRMDGEPFTVIGVMPPTFRFFGDDIAFWKPVPMNTTMVQSTGFAMAVIGRMKPGVAIQQAQSEMDAQAAQLAS